jgi:CDP-diacylglycerol---serine O-phosphatidyltransferase
VGEVKVKRKSIKIDSGRLATIPLSKLAPSIVTILALCLGITSIRYAIDSKWHIAAALIIIAGILDGIDGRLARLLNSTSGFGAQLDSLADIVSFGVAPAIVMYLWSLNGIPVKGVGWSVTLLFIACSALRLARFNSMLSDPEEKKKMANYFTGVPMPAGGASILLPMIASFEYIGSTFISPWFVAAYIAFISFLMVSKIPTFSFKAVHVKKEYVSPLLMVVSLLFAALLLEPWILLPLLNAIYLLTIPFSIFSYRRSKSL